MLSFHTIDDIKYGIISDYIPEPFEFQELIRPGFDFLDEFCSGWEIIKKSHDFPFKNECSVNMQQVFEAFINGALIPNHNHHMYFSGTEILFRDLHNTLCGEILNHSVRDNDYMRFNNKD